MQVRRIVAGLGIAGIAVGSIRAWCCKCTGPACGFPWSGVISQVARAGCMSTGRDAPGQFRAGDGLLRSHTSHNTSSAYGGRAGHFCRLGKHAPFSAPVMRHVRAMPFLLLVAAVVALLGCRVKSAGVRAARVVSSPAEDWPYKCAGVAVQSGAKTHCGTQAPASWHCCVRGMCALKRRRVATTEGDAICKCAPAPATSLIETC